MKNFKLPDLGEGLPEAEIVEWHVKVGDTVAVDQVLVSNGQGHRGSAIAGSGRHRQTVW